MPEFYLLGVKESTGKQNKRTYRAASKDAAWKMAEAEGITPTMIKQLPDPPPTEAQLDYAARLRIDVPAGCSKYEISDLISNAVEGTAPADERHRRFARRYGVELTPYTSKKEIFGRIHAALRAEGNLEELVAWFLFRVHRHLVGGSPSAEVEDADHPGLRAAAAHLVNDEAFVNSLLRSYANDTLIWFGQFKTGSGEVFSGASTSTPAYRAAATAMKRFVRGDEVPAPRPSAAGAKGGRGRTRSPARGQSPTQGRDRAMGAAVWLGLVMIILWIIL